MEEKKKINGIEHWISLFYEKLYSFFELLDDRYIFLLDHGFKELSQSRIDDIADSKITSYIPALSLRPPRVCF